MTHTESALEGRPPPAGHNQPPKTPFEAAEDRIDTLHIEAINWFDGEAIENQGQADAVSKLVDDFRKAKMSGGVIRVNGNNTLIVGARSILKAHLVQYIGELREYVDIFRVESFG